MSGLTHLSLFSGIGGLDLAAEWAGFETVGQVEWADYQTAVLARHWPDVARWRDVRDFTIQSFRERTGIRAGELDLLTGGPPCQPFSLAGNRKGADDERDMWPEYFRVVSEIRPRWCVAENVRGLLSNDDGRYFRGILRQFADLGYCVAWGIIRAIDAGAPHQRERVCFVAYSSCNGRSASEIAEGAYKGGDGREAGSDEPCEPAGRCERGGGRRDMAYAESTDEQGTVRDCNETGLCGFADSGALEHTSGTGQQEQHAPSLAGEARHASGRYSPGALGDADCRCEGDDLLQYGPASGKIDQPRPASPIERQLGDTLRGGCRGSGRRRDGEEPPDGHARERRAAQSGLGGLLDGISGRLDAQRWPASKGQPQHDWEPPRTGYGIPDRGSRLKGDGNAVVPQQFYPVMAFIATYERSEARVSDT